MQSVNKSKEQPIKRNYGHTKSHTKGFAELVSRITAVIFKENTRKQKFQNVAKIMHPAKMHN